MRKAAVDANVLLGKVSRRDQNHERGSAIFHGMDRGELPRGVLIPQTLLEVLHPIQQNVGHAAATEFFEKLRASAGFEIEWVSREEFTTARGNWADLALGADGPEVADVVLAEHLRSREIEHVYSFDDDFDEFSRLTRLNTATNPFEP